MSCSRWHRLIALEVGGDLDPRRSHGLERHLEGCAACRDLSEELHSQREELLRLDREAVEGVTLGSVRHAVLADLADRQRPFFQPPSGGRRLAYAGVTAVILLVAVVNLRQSGAPSQPRVVDRAPTEVVAPTTVPIPSPTTDVIVETSPEVAPPTPPESVEIRPMRLASADLPTTQREPSPLRSASIEPLTVKILTGDPDVIIYWIVEPKGDEDNA